MLRILIADDHEVARQGIRSLLESHPGWEVCGEAKHGRETVELASRMNPDLILLDIGMPNLNGLEAARQILAASPEIAILILTMHDSIKSCEKFFGPALADSCSSPILDAIWPLRSRPCNCREHFLRPGSVRWR